MLLFLEIVKKINCTEMGGRMDMLQQVIDNLS